MIDTITTVRAWNPLEWLEEPLLDPPYYKIRVGDEFARELTTYNALQAARNYCEAERFARSQKDIFAQTIRGSAFAHLGELYRRSAIDCYKDSSRYGRRLACAAWFFQRSADLYHLARDDHRLGVVARLYAWVQVRRENWEEALHSYLKAYEIFDGLAKNLRYLGRRERITTYRQWTREVEKEFEETTYQMRHFPNSKRIFVEENAETKNDEIKFVWLDAKLHRIEDLDRLNHSMHMNSSKRYEVHEIVEDDSQGLGFLKGDLALVDVPINGKYVAGNEDIIAIVVDSGGIKCWRVETQNSPLPYPEPDWLSKAKGKIVTILRKSA